jgi:phospholipid N-methyltransferase
MDASALGNQTLHFLGSFVRHPRQVGAVIPSSPILAKAMMQGLQLTAGQTLVELGPGTGAFTQAILRRLPAEARYLGVELNPRFVRHLQRRFPAAPRVTFVHGSAEDVHEHHTENALPAVRAVLCGLPFASLPAAVQDNVIVSLDRLIPPGGEFRTFQYVHAFNLPAAQRFRRRMDRLFGKGQRSRPVALNVPPAFVMRWTRNGNA